MNPSGNNESEKSKSMLPRIIIGTVIVLGLSFLGKQVWFAITHEETDNAQVEMRLAPILSRVSGYVGKIYTDDYAAVKKGQLLMDVDSTELNLQLQEMEADYAEALSEIENTKASLTNASALFSASKGSVEVVKARHAKATSDLSREKSLFEGNASTKRQLDDSQSNYDVSTKLLDASKIDLKVAQTRIAVLNAQVKKAQAQAETKNTRINQQRLKLSYCHIYAISDGKIGKRNIDEGQFIQAGTPVLTIVNSQSHWVVANFKESQLKNLSIGKIVHLKIDGYPNLEVQGKIVSLSDATGARYSLLPPDNATGNFVKVTQRVPVRIEFLDEAKVKDILRAGMSVVVSVPL
jgi:membrane fusion protein (multidrug efflux system)